MTRRRQREAIADAAAALQGIEGAATALITPATPGRGSAMADRTRAGPRRGRTRRATTLSTATSTTIVVSAVPGMM